MKLLYGNAGIRLHNDPRCVRSLSEQRRLKVDGSILRPALSQIKSEAHRAMERLNLKAYCMYCNETFERYAPGKCSSVM